MFAANTDPSSHVAPKQVVLPRSTRRSNQDADGIYDRLSCIFANRKTENQASGSAFHLGHATVPAANKAGADSRHFWLTGTRTRTMFRHIRHDNGTIVSESDKLWIAVAPQGYRMTFNKETSEIEVDQRISEGPFVKFVERTPLSEHIFSNADHDKKLAIERLLALLAQSTVMGGDYY